MPTRDNFELSATIGAAVNRKDYLDIIEAHVFEIAVKQFIEENLPPANDANIDSDKYVTPTFVIVRKQDILVMPSTNDTALFVEFEVAGKVGPRPFTQGFDYDEYLVYNLNYGFKNNSTGFQEAIMNALKDSEMYEPTGEPCDDENCAETKPCAKDIVPWVFFGVVCIILICTILFVYKRHCEKKKVGNEVRSANTEESFQICTSTSSSNAGMVVSVKPGEEGMDVRKCTSLNCKACSDAETGTKMLEVSPRKGILDRLSMMLISPRNPNNSEFASDIN